MLLDDDQFQLKLLSSVLNTLDAASRSILAFTQGSEALEYLASNSGANLLLMLDLNMQEMDGVKVVRQLSETGFSGGLILVSGEDRRVLETAARLASAHRLRARTSS